MDSIWANARRLRHEVLLANHRFPITAVLNASDSTLDVSAEVHVPAIKASFVVTFELTGEELATEEDGRRPAPLESVVTQVGSDVRVKYGQVE